MIDQDQNATGEDKQSLPGLHRPPRVAWALLAVILIFAGFVRFVGLDGLPPGLFRDEVEKGYNAWALANEGGAVEFTVDAQGRAAMRWHRWPMLIDVFGVRTSAIYQYASVPFVKVMGLSASSTRMAAATAGTLTVALLGALLLNVWKWPAALCAALWLGMCPWHIVFSRWAQQGIFVPLALVGALAGIAGVERGRRWGFPLAGASLGFMFHVYSGAQPFVLLWGTVVCIIYWKSIRAHPWRFALAVALLAAPALPRAWAMLQEGGTDRLGAIAIWTAEGSTPISVAWQFIRNYLAHFNPVFLFLAGDELPRHGIPGAGQLAVVDALLLPVGLVTTFRKKMPLAGVLLTAFLCAPIGAAITRVGIPHALRSLPMVVPAAVWGGVGLITVSQWIYRKVLDARSRNSGAANAKGAAVVFVALFAAVALGGPCASFAKYWTRYDGRDDSAGLAFAMAEREAFEELFAERAPGEAVYVNSRIPYAPYHVLFHSQLPGRDTTSRGMEAAAGIILFDPQRTPVRRILKAVPAGTWIVDYVPLTEDEAQADWLDPGRAKLIRKK